MGHLQKGDGARVDLYQVEDEVVAKIVAPMPEYRAAALPILAEIKANAARHRDSGALAASIRLEQGRVDWRIETDYVDYDFNTELGHYMGKRGTPGRKWIPGIRVFRSVVDRHGGF